MSPFLSKWALDAAGWGSLALACCAGLFFKPTRTPVLILLGVAAIQCLTSVQQAWDVIRFEAGYSRGEMHFLIENPILVLIGLYLDLPLRVVYDLALIWLTVIAARELRRRTANVAKPK